MGRLQAFRTRANKCDECDIGFSTWKEFSTHFAEVHRPEAVERVLEEQKARSMRSLTWKLYGGMRHLERVRACSKGPEFHAHWKPFLVIFLLFVVIGGIDVMNSQITRTDRFEAFLVPVVLLGLVLMFVGMRHGDPDED